MSVHDAELGDVYIDHAGKLWRVVSTCEEPTVSVQEIEKPSECTGPLIRRGGGVSGAMWQGWRRVYRPDVKAP